MASTTVWTYEDVYEHLLDVTGGGDDSRAITLAKTAILSAYREIPAVHDWSYYTTRGLIKTSEAYTTGTIAYDHTGGANERLITGTDTTFPTWAGRGMIYFNNNWYDVDQWLSTTTLQLSVNSNPGEDVAAGESYTLAREMYTMPIDFRATREFQDIEQLWDLTYVAPSAWMELYQTRETTNEPRYFTFTRDSDYIGVMAVRFYPPPDAEYHYYYVYQRMPHPLRILNYSEGTVAGTAATDSVTGTGTSWASAAHKGKIIRFGTTTDAPTGLTGLTPFVEDRVITVVGGSTSLTVDTDLTYTHASGTKYAISDAIDLDQSVMMSAFLECCEKTYRRMKRESGWQQADKSYKDALLMAMAADHRDLSGASGARSGPERIKMRDYAQFD